MYGRNGAGRSNWRQRENYEDQRSDRKDHGGPRDYSYQQTCPSDSNWDYYDSKRQRVVNSRNPSQHSSYENYEDGPSVSYQRPYERPPPHFNAHYENDDRPSVSYQRPQKERPPPHLKGKAIEKSPDGVQERPRAIMASQEKLQFHTYKEQFNYSNVEYGCEQPIQSRCDQESYSCSNKPYRGLYGDTQKHMPVQGMTKNYRVDQDKIGNADQRQKNYYYDQGSHKYNKDLEQQHDNYGYQSRDDRNDGQYGNIQRQREKNVREREYVDRLHDNNKTQERYNPENSRDIKESAHGMKERCGRVIEGRVKYTMDLSIKSSDVEQEKPREIMVSPEKLQFHTYKEQFSHSKVEYSCEQSDLQVGYDLESNSYKNRLQDIKNPDCGTYGDTKKYTHDQSLTKNYCVEQEKIGNADQRQKNCYNQGSHRHNEGQKQQYDNHSYQSRDYRDEGQYENIQRERERDVFESKYRDQLPGNCEPQECNPNENCTDIKESTHGLKEKCRSAIEKFENSFNQELDDYFPSDDEKMSDISYESENDQCINEPRDKPILAKKRRYKKPLTVYIRFLPRSFFPSKVANELRRYGFFVKKVMKIASMSIFQVVLKKTENVSNVYSIQYFLGHKVDVCNESVYFRELRKFRRDKKNEQCSVKQPEPSLSKQEDSLIKNENEIKQNEITTAFSNSSCPTLIKPEDSSLKNEQGIAQIESTTDISNLPKKKKKRTKPVRVFIRGLPMDFPKLQIKSSLQKLGFNVRQVNRNQPLNVFHVQLSPSDNVMDIFTINKLDKHQIKVVEPKVLSKKPKFVAQVLPRIS